MLSRLLAVLSLALLPSLTSASPPQIYLHPPLASAAQSPTFAEASALLAHHLRLDAFFPSPPLHGEIVLGVSKTFVGQGARDALILSIDASHAEDVIPEPLRPSFSLPTSSTPIDSLLNQYILAAHRTYHTVSTTSPDPTPRVLPKFLDIFALSASSSAKSDLLEKFLGSLSALVTFVEEKGEDRFGAFDVTGLADLESAWGRESEVYRTAAASIKAVIQSASTKPFSLAIVLSPSLRHLQGRQPPQSPLPRPPPGTAPVFSTSTCFSTAAACRNATSTCSSRGDCVGVTRAGRTCFVCACGKAPREEGGRNISWAGGMCQKVDLSQQFSLIVGTVLFLILVAGGSIALLYTVGGEELPGTLMGGGVGGHPKHS